MNLKEFTGKKQQQLRQRRLSKWIHPIVRQTNLNSKRVKRSVRTSQPFEWIKITYHFSTFIYDFRFNGGSVKKDIKIEVSNKGSL